MSCSRYENKISIYMNFSPCSSPRFQSSRDRQLFTDQQTLESESIFENFPTIGNDWWGFASFTAAL